MTNERARKSKEHGKKAITRVVFSRFKIRRNYKKEIHKRPYTFMCLCVNYQLHFPSTCDLWKERHCFARQTYKRCLFTSKDQTIHRKKLQRLFFLLFPLFFSTSFRDVCDTMFRRLKKDELLLLLVF